LHYTRCGRANYQAASGKFAARTKHGNYNAWLSDGMYDRYDCIVTFDPDHVPVRSYLVRLLGYFRDPGVAYVQAPQVYYNQRASFIARGAAEETYGYYSCDEMASYALGHPIVIGSHSVHRTTALRDVGGFPAHDAEDLYLTMLYRAHGWRGVYVPRILALGTTPVDWGGYLGQQRRWTRSVLDLKGRVLPALAARLSATEKLLNLFHGAYYLRPLGFLVLYAVLIAMLVGNIVPSFLRVGPLLHLGALLGLLTAIGLFRQRYYLDPERERGLHWRALVLQFAKWPHQLAALVDVLLRRQVGYAVTPKVELRSRLALTPPHLVLAAVVAGATALGLAIHGTVATPLVAWSGIAIVMSLALVNTERWIYPAPNDLAMLRQRRAEVAFLLDRGSPAPGAPFVTSAPEQTAG